MGDERQTHELIADDERTLHRLGYGQELLRRMSGFSNFAIALSIICILMGGITSFHLGFCSAGGASIGLGWPLVCLFSLAVAATMGQVASAFPTAGGLYHWASILGGRGWGWTTAWFNLAGLVTILAAVNVGTYVFLAGTAGPRLGFDVERLDPSTRALVQFAAVAAITLSQALGNHLGIRATTRLTDFSGYAILAISLALTAALLVLAPSLDPSRLWTFTNYSGHPEGRPVWPRNGSLAWLFALGFLLPAFTITGFDASAHTSEETIGASRNVPRALVRSVLVSGLFGWALLSALVLAVPDMDRGADQGASIVSWTLSEVFPPWLALAFIVAIGLTQYLCGLATVTSASRMVYAFARDGGFPRGNAVLRRVSSTYQTPAVAIWAVSASALLFAAYLPVYSTITSVCTLLLYVSYVVPTLLGAFAHGRTWTAMGPWSLGRLYRPLAFASAAGCVLLIAVGLAPPNDPAIGVLIALVVLLACGWFGFERKRFPGPPASLAGADPSEFDSDGRNVR